MSPYLSSFEHRESRRRGTAGSRPNTENQVFGNKNNGKVEARGGGHPIDKTNSKIAGLNHVYSYLEESDRELMCSSLRVCGRVVR